MPEDLSAAVAAVVRDAVAARGWSGRELARRAELSASVVAYKLAGERPFDIEDLERVAAALDTTAGELIVSAERRTGV